MLSLLVAPLLFNAARGCSIVAPDRPVFNVGLSLGPDEGDWVVTVGGSLKISNDNALFTEGEFFFNDHSGASLPVQQIFNDHEYRSSPKRPDFTVHYFKIEAIEGDKIRVSESEDGVVGEYLLPWAPREEGEFTVLTATPYAIGYWSSVFRKQVWVLEQTHEFGTALLHILDIDDGSWYEPTEFNGSFDGRGDWTQLKSLDEFGIVETSVPCCLCNSIEWVSFDSEGNTKSITMDPLNGDAGFDKQGNLLKTEFDSIFIFRAPEYEEELVVKYTGKELADALSKPLRCSEAKRDCPALTKPKVCGFENTMLKFAGATKSKLKGKFGTCGCESACADKGAEYWTLKVVTGRCLCYSGGKLKRAVRNKFCISSHGSEE